MGTPARLPRALRRAQLLETATRQFTRSGYHRTSVDSIAAAAGVTKPVLYQHFGSKEDLYLEVVRAVGARLITEIDQITDLEGGTRSRIAHGLHCFTTVLVESGTALRMLEASEAVSEEVIRAVTEIVGHAGDAIAQALMRHREIPASDAHILGQGLAALARANAENLASASTAEERERITALLTTFMSDGLRSFPPRATPGPPSGTLTAAVAHDVRPQATAHPEQVAHSDLIA